MIFLICGYLDINNGGFYLLKVVHGEVNSFGRITNEESIVGITGRMLLRLEQGVKIPEGALDKVVGRHFGEAHFKEDLAIFGSYLQQRMKVTTMWLDSECLKVVWLERGILPGSGSNHFRS